ncbi:ABC-F family ATP-binding cassette domain-containing protein [Alkalicella caledoniensis]|uniref:ABC-F family ATP-binding cassette domain-containing protein n=1 Tax=Alkalicella caledoniensis TaxID=2731377 RepID=A0A7G9WAS4_ALKCA|nr:ABC-F family ATP-binding cassette domain-containing protein [Alkalicella caledoniensis]QNO15786.1 ABC-F family ATP-binding cassette domain-containing protein [Alkalicella caledoniensis]
MSLLTLENIQKEYGSRELLKGVNLTVHRGERIALVGDNGTGKTTLLRIAMGEESAEKGKVIIGKGIKVGYLTQKLNETIPDKPFETALNYEKVAIMERRLRKLEESMSEAKDDQLDEVMRKYSNLTREYEAIDGYNIEVKIKTILLGLGLREEALTIPISKLSGGEKMRVALARILLEEPELLILDEPTNHLDIKAVEWLENFLKKFSGGVLIVSHDRYFLDQVATRVAELHGGITTEKSGNYSTYLEQKRIRKEFILKEQKRLIREMQQTEELVQKFMSMRKIKAARSREKVVDRLKVELKQQQSIEKEEHLINKTMPMLHFKKAGHISKNIAWANDLDKSFDNVNIFSKVSFQINGGEKIGIIGPNGCGKTTLINILLGKDKDFQGEAILGNWVKFGYLGQEITFEDETRSIIQEVQYKKEMLEKEAKRYLSRYQFFGDEVHKSIDVLSGGERVRVYLATLMLDEPYCLIMDEPTNHLDMAARDVLEKAIIEFKGTVIAISHDRYFLNRCITRIMEIENSKINSYMGNYDKHRNSKAKLQEANKQELKEKSKMPILPKNLDGNNAKDNEKTKEIEAEINSLEEVIKELEKSFDTHTDYKEYLNYQELTDKLNQQYARWEQLQ